MRPSSSEHTIDYVRYWVFVYVIFHRAPWFDIIQLVTQDPNSKCNLRDHDLRGTFTSVAGAKYHSINWCQKNKGYQSSEDDEVERKSLKNSISCDITWKHEKKESTWERKAKVASKGLSNCALSSVNLDWKHVYTVQTNYLKIRIPAAGATGRVKELVDLW